MPQTLTVNQNNDIFLDTNGNISTSFGIDAVLQACKTAAQAQLGEMIYAVNQGVPNFQTLWDGTPNVAQWEVALTNVLEAVLNVVNVLSLTVTIQNNQLIYQAIILTTYGEGTLNGIF